LVSREGGGSPQQQPPPVVGLPSIWQSFAAPRRAADDLNEMTPQEKEAEQRRLRRLRKTKDYDDLL
jgi:hypothetical protein